MHGFWPNCRQDVSKRVTKQKVAEVREDSLFTQRQRRHDACAD